MLNRKNFTRSISVLFTSLSGIFQISRRISMHLISGPGFILLVSGFTLLVGGCTEKEKEPAKPNVLFIAFDDLKPLAGCYGNDLIKTPNIDRLAASGTVFLNNQCQMAVCGPSRASLLTGLYPGTTRIWDLETKMRDVLPDVITIPQYFRQNGYFTTGVGKIFHGTCCDGSDKQDAASWSEAYMLHGGRGYAVTPPKYPANPKTGISPRGPSTECGEVDDTVYDDGQIRLVAIKALERLAGKGDPFFLAVGFMKPHLPFVAPKKYWDLYKRSDFSLAEFREHAQNAPEFAYHNSGELRNQYSDTPLEGPIPDEKQLELIHAYHASVSFVDAQLGMILDKLDELGLSENTIIVLWGDHGWHLGDHGLFCKHTNYEQATRSPLIFAAPGIKKNQKSTGPSEFIDIFPTLCDLAGLDIPTHLHGASLKPVLEGSSTSVKEVALSQYTRSPDGKPAIGYAYRSEQFRYVEWIQKDYPKGEKDGPVIARELYDYIADPLEKINVIDQPEYSGTVQWFEEIINSRKPASIRE